MRTGGVHFVYRALVYVHTDDSPEVCHVEHLCDATQYNLADDYGQIEDAFETKYLTPGMYRVWVEGDMNFYVHETTDGPDHDVEAVLTKQDWGHASKGDMEFLACPDVAPVTIFYSRSPVPDPDWQLHGTAKPHGAPLDSLPTYNVWTRIDDDKKTLYQLSRVGDKIPTLMDGAYYSLFPLLTLKGLALNLLIEGA